MTITTTHLEIGYCKNVDIVEDALRSRFGISDASGLMRTLSQHVWSHICNQGEDKTWGTKEIENAIAIIKGRLDVMSKQLGEK